MGAGCGSRSCCGPAIEAFDWFQVDSERSRIVMNTSSRAATEELEYFFNSLFLVVFSHFETCALTIIY